MIDKLVDISLEDLPKLRDIYKANWPVNHVGYYTLNNYIRWFNQDPTVPHVRFYSLNGDCSDGTFIISDRQMLILNTLGDQSRLTTALSLIDFSRGYTVSRFVQKVYDTVHDFFKLPTFEVARICPTKWYFMPRSEASKFVIEPRDDITLKPLSIEHAAIANELWPFKHPGSVVFLQRLAKYNSSFGAFTKDNQLIAWCFRLPSGSLGILEVLEAHKRQGIGSLLVKAMAKAIGDSDEDVFAPVVFENYPSQKMFESLGFKIVDTVYWMDVTSSVFETFMD